MVSPHAGVLDANFSYRKDFSGLPGTTMAQPRQSAELAPMRRSGEVPTRVNPTAGDAAPWQPAPSQLAAKMVDWIDSAVGEH
jgi:hypothetical protein